MLTVKNLIKKYDDQLVLDRLSFHINKGETAAIVGPSGSGKTTFLNIIGALEAPDSGSILFQDREIGSMSETERSTFRNEHIGFVFQKHYLLPQCTVWENVLIPTLAVKDKLIKKMAEEKAEYLLGRLGMLDHRHKLPGQLSGGECQRTAFVRALIREPELILADEPTGSLDEINAGYLSDELIELNKELNTTLIVVTHSVTLAQKMQNIWHFQHRQLLKVDAL